MPNTFTLREPDRFILTDEHVKLLRQANVSWDGCEFGAPGIDPKRPYGNGDVHSDIVEILGIESGSHSVYPRRLTTWSSRCRWHW